jgi:tRNA threonylcarbamoyladenosine modification (KEOPS) complex Cgi121 subunit
MMDFPDEEVCLAGIRGPVRLHDVLFVAAKSNRIAPLQVVRADRVVGPDHVRTAAFHSRRAEREGRSQAKTPELEFTRYLAGERQIRSALEKMGLRETEDSAVVVALGPKRRDALAHFVDNLGAVVDDALVEPTMEKLRAFGITEKQMGATTPARRLDLAMEAVALVDLMR